MKLDGQVDDERQPARLPPSSRPEDPVIFSPNGGALSRSGFERCYARIVSARLAKRTAAAGHDPCKDETDCDAKGRKGNAKPDLGVALEPVLAALLHVLTPCMTEHRC